VYFGELVFESDEQDFSLRKVENKKISSHPVFKLRVFTSIKYSPR